MSMRNDGSVTLVEGNWYMCRDSTGMEMVLKFTRDEEDAYYRRNLFGESCNVAVVCRMDPFYN